MSDTVECVKRRHRNAPPPELHVVFARIDPFGRFGGAYVGALHRAIESRGHCAPQGVVFVTTFKVSDGLGMSAHVASTLSFYIFAVQRRLIFAQVGIIRSHGDGSVTGNSSLRACCETQGRILSSSKGKRQVGK
ncbi:hypothetical protein [Caballeronia sp. GAWG1-5s-s]|uniref:hypothetical protein n=1 Tax=Caballeronia sp. GAWG1-5s-s TaxID=2921743 RepID=UPI0020292D1F|nr:hypothetical protein [Caballeronia sp. GAWG1-5s-s]